MSESEFRRHSFAIILTYILLVYIHKGSGHSNHQRTAFSVSTIVSIQKTPEKERKRQRKREKDREREKKTEIEVEKERERERKRKNEQASTMA